MYIHRESIIGKWFLLFLLLHLLFCFLWINTSSGEMVPAGYKDFGDGEKYPILRTDSRQLDVIGLVILWLVIYPILFGLMRLQVSVDEDAVIIHFRPLMLRARRIALADIVLFEAVIYKPLQEYGGRGFRGWGKKRVYTMKGKKGVRLLLQDGSDIMLGHPEPEELVAAIAARK